VNGKRLQRKNLLVDPDDLQRLKELYGVKSDSEAVRRACDLILMRHEVDEIAERIQAMGGPEDVYGRVNGDKKLPFEWPDDEPVDDLYDEVRREEQDAEPSKRRR